MHSPSEKFLRKNPHIAGRLEDCIAKIVALFKPEKIILFGSFARGEGKETSTMDLIIITKTKLSFFERIKKTLLCCKGGVPAIEPLIYTPKEFDLLLGQGEGFLEDAIEEGVLLYEKKNKR
jgi:hypothetical protein